MSSNPFFITVRESFFLLSIKILFLEFIYIFFEFCVRLFPNILDLFNDPYFFVLYSIIKTFTLFVILFHWYFSYYTISSEHIVFHSGMFLKRTESFSVHVLEELKLIQGVIGKLFHYGSIEIASSFHQTKMEIKNIAYPEKYIKLFETIHGEGLYEQS